MIRKRISIAIVYSVIFSGALLFAAVFSPYTTMAADDYAIGDNIVACWDLDEASGTRYDSAGTNDLTDNNTVGQIAGIVGGAADFISTNSEYLSIVDNADLSVGDVDFSVAGWFYADSTGGQGAFLGKDQSGSEREYILKQESSAIFFGASSDGSALTTKYIYNVFTSPGWAFIVAVHNAQSDTISVSVNGAALSGTAHAGGIYDGGRPFIIGATSGIYYKLDGNADSVMIFKRAVTNTDVTYLYNSGSGRSCSDVLDIPTPTPTPTNTPVPTVTETPSGAYIGSLESGDWYTIARSMTYGDLVIIGVTSVLLVFVVVGLAVIILKQWLS